MDLTIEIKHQLVQHCLDILEEKINLCKNSLKDISEDIKNETKSSAGDKFETSREMMQQERDKMDVQMRKITETIYVLQKISEQKFSKVETGALIRSNQDYIFFIPGFSSIEFQGRKIYTAAISSPIGQQLKGLSKNESSIYRGRKYTIEDII